MSDNLKQAIESEVNSRLNGGDPTYLYRTVMDLAEKPLLECALRRTKGNKFLAALLLGISRSTLNIKLDKHGLNKA